MRRLYSVPLVVALMSSAMPLFAADATEASDQSEIVITGERSEYGVKSTVTATKTNTAIKDIPQAMSVVTAGQIADQQLRSVADLLNFVPGASYGSGESNRDTLILRGNSSTADFFINGVRDDVQYFRDFYNVDRVEVLKGPNAMIFGRGGGGGIVNRVLKRPSLGSFRGLTVSGDGWGGIRLAGDIDQGISPSLGLRLNGLYENGDSFRRHVDLKRYGINPTAAVLAGQDTRLDFSYEYFHDRRTADRGIPSQAGEPVHGFTKTFFGDPRDSYARVNASIASLAVEHSFAEGLTLRNRTMFGSYDKFYQNIFAGGAVLPATATLPERVRLNAYNNRNDRDNLLSQTDLVWESTLGKVEQTLLLGFEVGRQKSRNYRTTGTFSPLSEGIVDGNAVPLTDPTVDLDMVWAPIASDANNRTKATIAAFYAQEQIRPTSWLEIVAGMRFDSFKVRVNDLRPAVNNSFERNDNLWSPRLGVVLKPRDNLSFYGSYSRSYLPQSGDQFSGLDVNTETLKPERFDNYEVGAKWELLDGLLATAAIYKLDRTNTRVANPDGSGTFLLTGAQRSRGIELGLERSVTSRWLVSAGYTLQKAEITERTTACNPDVAQCEVPLVPRHSFSLWNRYDVTKQIGVGLGVVSRSKSYTSINNGVTLPGYTRFDAALFYELPRGLEAQVNFENLFGAKYFPTSNGDNNIAPGAPRAVRATVGFKF